ncbi:reprolysin-like metallopeptidase [Marinomonas balearica]|uniref:Reprolysin-like metallo-peptidase family M12B n=1 Tax=Marinomonas balearica TaxID=491947 RepID=A0A4R6M619_9GAMM|nr:zinc-dependent metalloprotease family protein [Marinomonas balearica]TDO96265.1 reprolysin-like metallo-peptidase family M12B [Marinomonas balearica]
MFTFWRTKNESLFDLLKIACGAFVLLGSTLALASPSTAFFEDRSLSKKSSVARSLAGHTASKLVQAESLRPLNADNNALKQYLLDTSLNEYRVDLPLPDGQSIDYILTPYSVLSSTVAEQFPDMRQFKGHAVNNPELTGRFDVSLLGFRGLFDTLEGQVTLDPTHVGNTSDYASYYARSSQGLDPTFNDTALRNNTQSNTTLQRTAAYTPTLKTYRLAVSAAYEFTNFYGGQSGAFAGITSMVNRLNEVYEKDLGVTFTLVSGTNTIVSSANAGPFNNNSNDIDVNQAFLNQTIGSDNYDIGHVVNTGGGGLAQLGVVCDDDYKAEGVTGRSNPTGDAFFIDYVAHEIGHQFGAEHTFNGTIGSCSGNRNQDSAVEPGSGSTIMAYAGICGALNLQDNSTPHFHAYSINEINQYLASTTGSSCGTFTSQSNTAPSVDAGDDITVPANTPFILTGSATDTENDNLTYIWEEMDTGSASSSVATMVDNGTRPLFRSWEAVDSSTRYLPRLEDLVDGELSLGESYPNTSRTLNFRLTVRQESSGGSSPIGTNYDDKIVTVDSNSGPFYISSPNINVEATSGETITLSWNVANTSSSPVNCSNVDVLLADQGNSSFSETGDHVLAEDIQNTGQATILVPNLNVTNRYIMLRCSNNAFFALSPCTFTLNGAEATNSQSCTPRSVPPLVISDNAQNSGSTSSSSSSSTFLLGSTSMLFYSPLILLVLIRIMIKHSKFFRLTVIGTLIGVISTGCTTVDAQTESSTWLKKELKRVTDTEDYRLITQGGRGEPLPGVNAEEFEKAKQLCGTINLSLSDVIRSDAEMNDRKNMINDIIRFNKTVWPLCQKHSQP